MRLHGEQFLAVLEEYRPGLSGLLACGIHAMQIEKIFVKVRC